MTKIFTAKALKPAILNQKFLACLFAVLAIGFIAFYIASVNIITFNTFKRSQINKEISFLNYKIGELEFELISKKNSINMNLAQSMGFKEVEDIKFISKKSVATILNVNSIR